MIRKLTLTAGLMAVLISGFLYGTVPQGVDFSIRFYDQELYYPESDIFLHLRIKNNSGEVFRFNMADIRSFNVELSVRTLSNVAIPSSEEFIIQRKTNQQVFYREISILPGEEHAFVINLRSFSTIPGPGIYVLKALFFPQFQARGGPAVESNTLTLSIRPSLRIPEFEDRVDSETGEILKKSALPPDEVVAYTIRARQRDQWERFFLYLDPERLMLRNPRIEVQYRRAPEERRMRMIEEYRDALKAELTDNEILMRPDTFEILKTTYTAHEATVLVAKRFVYRDYTELRRYTYYLNRADGYWTIHNYDVRNLGTE